MSVANPETVRRVARLQALSGLTFAFFLTLHLATTSAAVLGPAGYDRVLVFTRSFYRPLLAAELLLIGIPAVVHIACAVIQMRLRRRAGPLPRPPLAVRLHRWSGLFMMLAITGHVLATRILVRSDFSVLAFAMEGLPAFFVPYYLLLGAAGAIHLTLGAGFGIARLLPGSAALARRPARLAAAAAALVVTIGVASIIAFTPQADRSRFPEFQALVARVKTAMTGTRVSARP
jgi:succinate dehydrogenase/fumarate reductase cytochrome b subunit